MDNVDMFLEDVERDYSEAVLMKQIPKSARDTVEKSRSGHKEVDSMKLALLRKVVSKDFHAMKPDDKAKIVKSLGFGDNEQGKKSEKGYTVVEKSKVHPDVLYGITLLQYNPNAKNVKGMTFIADRISGQIVASDNDPHKMHDDVAWTNRIRSDRGDVEAIHGRIVSIKKPFYHEYWETNIDKGTTLALWNPITKDELDTLIDSLPENMKPDYVHLPHIESSVDQGHTPNEDGDDWTYDEIEAADALEDRLGKDFADFDDSELEDLKSIFADIADNVT